MTIKDEVFSVRASTMARTIASHSQATHIVWRSKEDHGIIHVYIVSGGYITWLKDNENTVFDFILDRKLIRYKNTFYLFNVDRNFVQTIPFDVFGPYATLSNDRFISGGITGEFDNKWCTRQQFEIMYFEIMGKLLSHSNRVIAKEIPLSSVIELGKSMMQSRNSGISISSYHDHIFWVGLDYGSDKTLMFTPSAFFEFEMAKIIPQNRKKRGNGTIDFKVNLSESEIALLDEDCEAVESFQIFDDNTICINDKLGVGKSTSAHLIEILRILHEGYSENGVYEQNG